MGAIARAIADLKVRFHDRKEASLMQANVLTGMELIPMEAKKVIDAFAQSAEDPSGLEVAAQQVGYESQSGGVIEMLDKLQDKFTRERTGWPKRKKCSPVMLSK